MQFLQNEVEVSVDRFSEAWTESFRVAAEQCLPKPTTTKKRPWISDRTLSYIQQRHYAKSLQDKQSETHYTKLIKHSVKQDRADWLQDMLHAGDWKAIQRFRKHKHSEFNKLRDHNGQVCQQHERAEAFARHLETVQWAVRPDTVPSTKPALFDFSHIACDPFTPKEIQMALKALKNNRSPGDDGIPGEFWKVCLESQILLEWLTKFCSVVWLEEKIPQDWQRARVACIFKKGDPTCPDNYRPISLLQIGYKLFSSMILARLTKNGVEDKLWRTQFGFRSGCGTRDAIFIARRLIEQCHKQCHNCRNQHVVFLALDWAKAFDSIDPNV